MKKIYLALLLVLITGLSCQTVPSSPSEDALAPTVADALVALEAAGPPSNILPNIGPRPRPPSSFVPASPDTRSQKDIDAAACWGFEDGKKAWRCKGKPPVTFMAGASSPIIPASWTVPNWFVNKTTGNDGNACTTSGSPCATKQEIWVHRWGMNGSGSMNCPRFRQTVTLEQDASDTDDTDPIYACAMNESGGSFIIQGGPFTATAAVFTLNTAKNTAAGTNALLSGSFSAGSPGTACTLVTNTTALKSSRAWVYKTAGGANWNLSQPCAPITGFPDPTLSCTEVNTWASTDTVTLGTPIAINVASANAQLVGFDGAFGNGTFLYNAILFDPGISDHLIIGRGVQVAETCTSRVVAVGPTTHISTFVNSNFKNTVLSSATSAFSGGAPTFDAGIIGAFSALTTPPSLQDDIILAGQVTLSSGGFLNLGNIFLDGQLIVQSGLVAQTAGIVYGSGANTINLNGSSHWANTSGTFTAKWTAPGLVTGVKINGSTTADTHSGANPDVITTGVTCSPGNMDGAGVPGCFLLAGASATRN